MRRMLYRSPLRRKSQIRHWTAINRSEPRKIKIYLFRCFPLAKNRFCFKNRVDSAPMTHLGFFVFFFSPCEQWHKVQQSAKFTILEQYMDPSSNFSSYRSTLKAALWRSAGATDQRQRVVIPFFSLLVKDIYFLNEGCRNR